MDMLRHLGFPVRLLQFSLLYRLACPRERFARELGAPTLKFIRNRFMYFVSKCSAYEEKNETTYTFID